MCASTVNEMFVVDRQPGCPNLEESRASAVAPAPGQPDGLAREREPLAHGHARDAALARLAVAGDRSAQRTIFRQLKGSLHSTLYRVLGSNAHMEDLLQKTFLALFRALPFYLGEDPLTLWSDRITLRVAGQHLREQRSIDTGGTSRSEPGPTLRFVTSTQDAAEHRRGVARLYEQLRRLRPEQQIAFALFELDGRSLEEVAELTGVSLAQARNRTSSARASLWVAARGDEALAQCLRQEEAVRP